VKGKKSRIFIYFTAARHPSSPSDDESMKTFMSDSSLGWMHGSDGDAGTVQINAGIVNHQPMDKE